MGVYLELPDLNDDFLFRSFVNEGDILVYPHWHKEIEIIYVREGDVNIGVNDVPLQLKRNDIYMINGGDVHYFLASPESERIVIQFDLSFFQDISTLEQTTKKLRNLFSSIVQESSGWPEDVAQRVRELLVTVHEENLERRVGYRYVIKAKMFELLALLYREIPQNENTQTRQEISSTKQMENLERLDKIFTYIENHYHETITLNEIASYMGFSSFYFTKFFKKNTGTTFIQFLTDYRLNKAKWILLNEDASVTEVAEQTGFSSVKTFHHQFKDLVGSSPLKYKKTISGNI
ncbi:AraC family transcriptional regulator [Carnobacterium gallinarum]|uniref:AraC family transcriptional regulator n=1 Tax=Carnobacterium gallinarum TaxID=2749 RepID=UPI00055635AA|nr:AraC family transcriptional regulator [Carnobacterium gallinarum]